MSTPEEKITRESYNKIARRWSEKNGAATIWDEEIKNFFRLLGKKKSILEIGSGCGRDAEIFIKAGYKYTGVDVSSSLLDIARKRVPGTIFLEQSVYELNFPGGVQFDGFWTSATLLHIPKTRIGRVLRKIKKFVKDGGIGFISVKEGVGEKTETGMTGYGSDDKRFFAYYSKEEFGDILSKNGLEIVKAYSLKINNKTTYLCFFVRVIK